MPLVIIVWKIRFSQAVYGSKILISTELRMWKSQLDTNNKLQNLVTCETLLHIKEWNVFSKALQKTILSPL